MGPIGQDVRPSEDQATPNDLKITLIYFVNNFWFSPNKPDNLDFTELARYLLATYSHPTFFPFHYNHVSFNEPRLCSQ